MRELPASIHCGEQDDSLDRIRPGGSGEQCFGVDLSHNQGTEAMADQYHATISAAPIPGGIDSLGDRLDNSLRIARCERIGYLQVWYQYFAGRKVFANDIGDMSQTARVYAVSVAEY